MRKRTLVAASTLAALPVMVITLQATVATNPMAHWAWSLGMSRGESAAFGVAGAVVCSFIPGIGSLACGLTGVF